MNNLALQHRAAEIANVIIGSFWGAFMLLAIIVGI